MTDKTFVRPGQESQPNISFVRPAELAKEGITGVIVEGEFVESLPNHFDEEKSDYKFVRENGDVVVINHTGSLAYRMKKVSPGDFCQVSYNGKTTIENGKMKGKQAHDFEVLVAREM